MSAMEGMRLREHRAGMRARRSAQEGCPEKEATGTQHKNEPERGRKGERELQAERENAWPS